MDETERNQVFCDTHKLEKYIDFPAEVNTSAVVNVLCQLNLTELIKELEKEFNVKKFVDDVSTHILNIFV